MPCDVACSTVGQCSTTGGDLTIGNFYPPEFADAGSQVTLEFDVVHCGSGWCGEEDAVVCVFDTFRNQCVNGTVFHSLAGAVTHVKVPIIMPSGRNFNGNLSLIKSNFITGKDCTDTNIFQIKLNVPAGTRWSCNSDTKVCVQDTQGIYSDPDACAADCGGIGGGGCSPSDSNVLGMCVPKPVLLLGGLFLIYSIINR